ncbi:glycosyltransferase family 2 protein [Candidatus Microgenomates bacterium]|nr:glycosyltransferase family 2 protein [Candidatus Microgenomates bacterium]
MNVSVIIPTRNRAEILKKTLSALVKQVDREDEVLVVDNGSLDNTWEVVSWFQSKFSVKYFFEPQKGPSFARNLGVKRARGEIIAFLDDDCVVQKNWLSEIKALSRRSAKGIVYQGKIVHHFSEKNFLSEQFALRNKKDWRRIRQRSSFKKGGYLQFLLAGNFFLRKKILGKLDCVFDAKLFPFIGEERDLAARLQLAGCKIVYASQVAVRHLQPKGSIFNIPRVAFLYGRTEGILNAKYGAKPKIAGLFKKEIAFIAQKPSLLKRTFGMANHFLKKGKAVYLGAAFYFFVRETIYVVGRLYGRMIIKVLHFLKLPPSEEWSTFRPHLGGEKCKTLVTIYLSKKRM